MAPNSWARWPSTRTSTDSATCEALRASSSRWPRNSSEAFTAFAETCGALRADLARDVLMLEAAPKGVRSSIELAWIPPVGVVSGGVTARDNCRRRKDAQGAAPSLPHPRPESEPTMLEAGYRWLGTYVATTRNAKGQRLARTRFDTYIVGWLGVFPLR